MSSFSDFLIGTSLVSPETIYYERAHNWSAKRDAVTLYIHDFPRLIEEYKARGKAVHQSNPLITRYDVLPSIRLSNACEASTNALYSLAEVAANFGNRCSDAIPQSFHSLLKKVAKGECEQELVDALGDVQ